MTNPFDVLTLNQLQFAGNTAIFGLICIFAYVMVQWIKNDND